MRKDGIWMEEPKEPEGLTLEVDEKELIPKPPISAIIADSEKSASRDARLKTEVRMHYELEAHLAEQARKLRREAELERQELEERLRELTEQAAADRERWAARHTELEVQFHTTKQEMGELDEEMAARRKDTKMIRARELETKWQEAAGTVQSEPEDENAQGQLQLSETHLLCALEEVRRDEHQLRMATVVKEEAQRVAASQLKELIQLQRDSRALSSELADLKRRWRLTLAAQPNPCLSEFRLAPSSPSPLSPCLLPPP